MELSIKISPLLKVTTAPILFSLLLNGCVTPIKPTDLRVPAQVSCIYLPTELEATDVRGLLKYVWKTHLARGPYIAERESEKGTYYRAPPGGISIYNVEGVGKPDGILTHMTYDGGIFSPRDPALPPSLYTYFSVASAPVVTLPENTDCSTATYVRDPVTRGVSVAAFAVGGAIGGATGAAIGHSMSSNNNMSSGQAVGAGAIGGAIGGAIIASMINNDIGKIVPVMTTNDQQFISRLTQLVKNPVPIKEAPKTIQRE